MFKRTRISLAISTVFSAGLVGYLPAALGQQAAEEPKKLDRVEITGSSIKRIEGETGLPVQVITREDIQRTGAATVEQLMQQVSAAASSQALAAASASGATTLGISSISLRGLSSLRTLVLVNGKRITPYGYGFTNDAVSVDVNSIPVAAIERVEILKDGASAIYGSDAIAGVVNFILRKDYKGLEVNAEYGQPKKTPGSIARFNGVYGIGDLSSDHYNAMLTISYQKEKSLFGRDRKFASSGINFDFLNDTTSGNTFPANIAAADGSFGTRNPTFPACPGPYAINSPVYTQLLGSLGCRFDPAPLVTLIPDTKRISVFTSGRFQITPAVEVYGEASFSRNEQRTIIQPTPISDQFALAPNNPLFNVAPYNGFSTILITSASPFYPTAFVQSQAGGATPDILVRWRANLAGNRDLTDTSEAPRLNFGVKGTVANWDYDGGVLYSESKVREHTNNGFVIQSQILPILNRQDATGVDFWGNTTSAQTLADIEATQFRGDSLKTKTSLASVYGKVSSELAQIAGGPLALALGAELRREKYALTPSSQILAGDLTGYGGNFLPVDTKRNVTAFFAELNVPIVRTLEANFAARYDNYEKTGSSTTPKVALRFQPTQQVLLRAAWGRGFRAPSLLDLYAPQTTGVTAAGSNDPLRCSPPLPPGQGTGAVTDCGTQFATLNGGNPNLKPEKSRSITAGIVLEPTNNISLGVDWFNIKLTDTINNGIPSATILAPATYAQFANLVTRGPVDPAFPNLPGPITQILQTNLNVGVNRLEGADLDIRWGIPAGAIGKFTVGLNGTYFKKFDQQNLDGTFTGTVDQANNATGGVVPRWKHYLSVNWAIGPFSTTVAQNYQSSYTDFPAVFDDPAAPVHATVGSYETYDFQTAYSGIKNLTLTFGVRNVFDRDPPYTNAGGQLFFQSGYDPSYADPRGRFYYGRVAYKFF